MFYYTGIAFERMVVLAGGRCGTCLRLYSHAGWGCDESRSVGDLPIESVLTCQRMVYRDHDSLHSQLKSADTALAASHGVAPWTLRLLIV